MIEPWQVWLIDLSSDGSDVRPAVVVSSDLHLRTQQGRNVLVSPVTSRHKNLHNRVEIRDPQGDAHYVVTEQVRFISTARFVNSDPVWTLADQEIDRVKRALRMMAEF